MDTPDALSVVRAFVAAINIRSAEKLAALMTEDHLFIDSDGGERRGKSTMAGGWADYFALVPDYTIVVKEEFQAAGAVMLAGLAEGTFIQAGSLKSENHWRVPAAWRAVVRGGKVAVWQVYVNPEIMSRILARTGGA